MESIGGVRCIHPTIVNTVPERRPLDDIRRCKLAGTGQVAVLDLKCGMAYGETLPQLIADMMHKDIISASLGADEMHR